MTNNPNKSSIKCIWLTGLSGAGKSTLSERLLSQLNAEGHSAFILDGDLLRAGLCADLDMSEAGRNENIRRAGHVAKLLTDAGQLVIAAFITPYQKDRDFLRQLFKEGEFLEVHLSTALDVCEARDPKGLYKKARAGAIKGFTGIDAPFAPPTTADIIIDTSRSNPDECAEVILNKVLR